MKAKRKCDKMLSFNNMISIEERHMMRDQKLYSALVLSHSTSSDSMENDWKYFFPWFSLFPLCFRIFSFFPFHCAPNYFFTASYSSFPPSTRRYSYTSEHSTFIRDHEREWGVKRKRKLIAFFFLLLSFGFFFMVFRLIYRLDSSLLLEQQQRRWASKKKKWGENRKKDGRCRWMRIDVERLQAPSLIWYFQDSVCQRLDKFHFACWLIYYLTISNICITLFYDFWCIYFIFFFGRQKKKIVWWQKTYKCYCIA